MDIKQLEATPKKKLYYSIIADYDLKKGLSELIDNAIDNWKKNKFGKKLLISINFDPIESTIIIKDNSGGVSEENLENLVSPGASSSSIDSQNELIGVFGVGTKRSVIALAKDIKIKTRYHNSEETFFLYYDEEWIRNDSWLVPYYKIENIEEGSTIIELSKLRYSIDESVIEELKHFFSKTYAYFLKNSTIILKIDEEKIAPKFLENWSYPPEYKPKKIKKTIINNSRKIEIEIKAGFNKESSPTGKFGFTFYCNDRLIREYVQDEEVGYTKGKGGLPHSTVSAVNIFVFINGYSIDMPWNSSKSGINYSNQIFLEIKDYLIELLIFYNKISRSFKGKFKENLGHYDYENWDLVNLDSKKGKARGLMLPEIKFKKNILENEFATANKHITKTKKYTKGICETMDVVNLILKKKHKFETVNRMVLILMDSMLEIAFKDYLVYVSDNGISDKRLTELNRNNLHEEIKKIVKIEIKNEEWELIDQMYRNRCELIHKKSNAYILDEDIQSYQKTVKKILNKLFKLNF